MDQSLKDVWNIKPYDKAHALIDLKINHLLLSPRFLANRWGWSTTKVYNFLLLINKKSINTNQLTEAISLKKTAKKTLDCVNLFSLQKELRNMQENKKNRKKNLKYILTRNLALQHCKNQSTINNKGIIYNIYIYKEKKEKEINKEKETKELFEKFWKVYPRKINKHKAYISFKGIKGVLSIFPTLMEGLQKYISSEWSRTELKFIPYPTTWLNQRRWEDEIDTKTTRVVNCINPDNPNEVILTNGSIYAKKYCMFINNEWRRI